MYNFDTGLLFALVKEGADFSRLADTHHVLLTHRCHWLHTDCLLAASIIVTTKFNLRHAEQYHFIAGDST